MAAAAIHTLHVVYAALLVSAPLWVLGGALVGVRWLASPGVRRLHLGCVAFTGAQYVTGVRCPLTTLENWLAGRPAAAPFVPAEVAEASALVAGFAAAYLFATAVAHVVAARSVGVGEPAP